MQAEAQHFKPSDKLVAMANQIAKAFAAQGETRAVPQIAEHIRLFWNPAMRAGLSAHVATGGQGLDDLALKAARTLD